MVLDLTRAFSHLHLRSAMGMGCANAACSLPLWVVFGMAPLQELELRCPDPCPVQSRVDFSGRVWGLHWRLPGTFKMLNPDWIWTAARCWQVSTKHLPGDCGRGKEQLLPGELLRLYFFLLAFAVVPGTCLHVAEKSQAGRGCREIGWGRTEASGPTALQI